jgi:hypothetical protein
MLHIHLMLKNQLNFIIIFDNFFIKSIDQFIKIIGHYLKKNFRQEIQQNTKLDDSNH